MKNRYTIPVKFVFEGEFYITCDDKQQAKELIKEHVFLCLGNNIECPTIPEEVDIDWDFDVHSEQQLLTTK